MDSISPIQDPAERDSALGVPVNVRGTLFAVSQGNTSACTVTRLSVEECRVRTDRDFGSGADARVEMRFLLKGTAFRVAGLTQPTTARKVLGVRFVGLSESRKAELRKLLDEVDADLTAASVKEAADRAAAAEAVASARAQVEVVNAELAAARAGEAAARRAAEAAAQRVRETTERLRVARTADAAAGRLYFGIEARESTRREAPNAAPESESSPSRAQTDGVPARERRREARHAVDATARIVLLDARCTIAGQIVDLSMSGCRIRCPARFPLGIYRRVEVEFVLNGLPFRLSGVVQSLHDRATVGIRFLDLSPRKREQLKRMMEEIAEMRCENAQGA